ncbi:EamA family transporter [Lysinibacillus parviboronicapiens]|uniref:EamA family transporter n=1 Tax=Lysinibacillus parviboronicapiens TaxID=436516 RepID=UPI000B242930|nr:DMT family transporter [Lysinibacillus parviboronicapiens]
MVNDCSDFIGWRFRIHYSLSSWNSGVIQLGANKASIYRNFIPVFASIFAVIFLGEKLHGFQFIGGLAVVAGVYIKW